MCLGGGSREVLSCLSAGRERERQGADLPQKSADSQRKSNAATLSAVHKRAQDSPVRRSSTLTARPMVPSCSRAMPERIPMRSVVTRTRRIGALTAAALAGALVFGDSGRSAAANFPDHPIKLIVPFGAGGPPDVAARIIGAYISEHLGPVVVENHVGAGGTLAARLVATSPPDGYTLLAGTAGSLSISPQLYKDAGHRPGQAVRCGRARVLGAARARRPKIGSRTQRQGTGRLRQGQSRKIELRRGDRHAAASERRNVQAHHRRQHRVRALQDARRKPPPTCSPAT